MIFRFTTLLICFFITIIASSCTTQHSPPSFTPTDSPRSLNKIQLDLIGHTMGGREKAWKFQSIDQILVSSIDKNDDSGNYIVDLVLHDSRVNSFYFAKAVLHYDNIKLQSVGLLYIEKIETKF